MEIIRWEEPPEAEHGDTWIKGIIEELWDRPEAFALVLENQDPIVARNFAKELEMADGQVETEVRDGSVYARWCI